MIQILNSKAVIYFISFLIEMAGGKQMTSKKENCTLIKAIKIKIKDTSEHY